MKKLKMFKIKNKFFFICIFNFVDYMGNCLKFFTTIFFQINSYSILHYKLKYMFDLKKKKIILNKEIHIEQLLFSLKFLLNLTYIF